ncbi:hypothetical protein IF1G_07746 [Cordyceps javanica]|uniref:Uncharacterized protein n=1 Tax=Cordyceps javanica TaxID=43265 RepID=A0A545UX12_9HYPO|nr:hypothetical protein IF1G_07746 [Cordyceps javanica]
MYQSARQFGHAITTGTDGPIPMRVSLLWWDLATRCACACVCVCVCMACGGIATLLHQDALGWAGAAGCRRHTTTDREKGTERERDRQTDKGSSAQRMSYHGNGSIVGVSGRMQRNGAGTKGPLLGIDPVSKL